MESVMNTRQLALLLILLVSLLINFAPTTHSLAQAQPSQIKCGDIVEAELTKQTLELGFQILTGAGTTLNGRIEPLGETLNLQLIVQDANRTQLFVGSKTKAGQPEPFEVQLSASNPTLYVSAWKSQARTSDTYYGPGDGTGDVGALGVFTVYLGCTLRDGTVIKPGDTAPQGSKGSAPVKAFSGVGFPGLPAVDFADAVSVSLQPTGSDGKLPPTGNTILGYNFTGKGGSDVTLVFTRKSGNLNLGLVVLGPQNQLIFQASLINTTALTASFTLPADGEYTVGVFRSDLLPPASPEATAFQIQIK
jgi:hypothetical protein